MSRAHHAKCDMTHKSCHMSHVTHMHEDESCCIQNMISSAPEYWRSVLIVCPTHDTRVLAVALDCMPYTPTHMHAHAWKRTCAHARNTHIHTHTHTRTHTHTHTHTHTRPPLGAPGEWGIGAGRSLLRWAPLSQVWRTTRDTSVWMNKSFVKPKSTSNKSSKPCTVLQYPSR